MNRSKRRELTMIGMVQKRGSVGLEDPRDLVHVRLDHPCLDVHQESKLKTKSTSSREPQPATPIVHVVLNVIVVTESLLARSDALLRKVDQDQPLALFNQELRPPPKAGRNLQDGVRRQMPSDSRKNGAIPLGLCPAPALDHSSPPPDQSYSLSQKRWFKSTLGIVHSVHEHPQRASAIEHPKIAGPASCFAQVPVDSFVGLSTLDLERGEGA